MFIQMPPVHEDPRFDQITDEAGMVFMNIYSLSAREGKPPGTLGTGPVWVASFLGGRDHAGYYESVMWDLESVGLLSYDDLTGWAIPDFDAWNDPIAVPVAPIKAKGQLTLTAMPSAEFASPLNLDQRAAFGIVWEAYPVNRRGARFECEREWAKINPDPAAVGRILGAIELFQKYDEDWNRGAVPQFRRFLHGRHWLSAPVPSASGPIRSGSALERSKMTDRDDLDLWGSE